MRSRLLTLLLTVLLLLPQPVTARDEDAVALGAALELSITRAEPNVVAETGEVIPKGAAASSGGYGESSTPFAGPNTEITPSDSQAVFPLPKLADLRLKFEPSLLKKLLAGGEGVQARGIVMMHEQEDVGQMQLAGMARSARIRAMVARLQATADRSQVGVRNLLAQAQERQQVRSFQPLWIVNGIAVEGRAEVFWTLAAHPDVDIILEDHVQVLPDARADSEPRPYAEPQLDPVQWNVQRVKADLAWDILGVTGEGMVVANLDTGVDWEHPLLKPRYRGYTGKPFVDHTGNWYCATNEGYVYPGDGHGHGTHTIGTIVGLDGIGVAPGAQWIAVKIFTNQGLAYNSWIHAGLQWVLAPAGNPDLAPDVVNNSWGNPNSTYQEFRPDVQALRAAGILPIFSAGNYGPNEETIATPASFQETFAVGATDRDDLVARFSSRGPSPWDEIKPEVSAPGVDVLSTATGGGLRTMDGTSMAAPHVAGVAALMGQANPGLTADDVESILLQTAVPLGEEHPNNQYGWGLVDAYAAVVQAGQFGRLAGQIVDAVDDEPIAGAAVRATTHDGSRSIVDLCDPSGHYELGLSADRYDVTVSAFGYLSQTHYGIEITTGVTTTLDVGLIPSPTGLLAGSVREAGSDAPLLATVRVPGTPASTTTEGTGGAYVLSLPVGQHAVRVEASAHRFVTATVTISAGEQTTQDFWLEPAPTILLVDSGAWYNDSQIAYYTEALEGLSYLYDRHTIANVDLAPTDVPTAQTFLPYDVVIWSAPSDAPGYIGAQAAITHFLRYGGRLLLSGQDVAFWDGGGSGAYWAPYVQSYLRARFVADDAPGRILHGLGPLFQGLTLTITGTGGADNQVYPDVIASTDADHAASAMAYQGEGSGGQTVGPCLPYRALYFAFGLEGINDTTARREVLARSIDWLVAPPVPAGIELLPGGMPQIAPSGAPVTHSVRLRNTGEVGYDTYSLDMVPGSWSTTLLGPSEVTLDACHAATLDVRVYIPASTGWHVSDTATLSARSTLSPSLEASATLVSKTPAPVLLVDSSRFYQVDGSYRDALESAGIPYDYHRVKRGWPTNYVPTQTLSMYPLLVWYTAYDWYEPLSELEEEQLIGYLESGGRLYLSAQDYLYYGADRTLARDYLGVFEYREDVETTLVQGELLHPIGWGLGTYTLTYAYPNWSDGILPVPEADAVMRGQHDLPAAVTHQGDGWRTSFAAFPFETLDPDGAAETMVRTVGWLSWLGASTWEGDQRVVEAGSQVTLTCVLRNDGWEDVTTAHYTTALPAELSFVDGSLTPGAVYHVPTRTVSWQGGLSAGEALTIQFRVQTASPLPDLTDLPVPARIGYDDHHIYFERPYVLSVNASDLSSSSLAFEPASGRPGQVMSVTLAVRNTGVRDAAATVQATAPAQTVFTGTLDSGGVGAGDLISTTVSWTGPVPAGGQVLLHYQLALDGLDDYWLYHIAKVGDQNNQNWYPTARAYVAAWRTYLPLVVR